MTVPLLVSCEWLNERLFSGDIGELVILDVSWSSSKDFSEEYKKRHIPGSSYVNVLDAKHTDVYPRNIPTAEAFTEQAQKVGVNSDSHVIVYSDSDKAGFFISGRGWWTFKYFGHRKVSILDGGLQKWVQKGFPTTDTETTTQRGNFIASIYKDIHRTFEDVDAIVKAGNIQLVDSRPDSAFKESHIPGAVGLEMSNLVDNDKGILKSIEELKAIFREAGVDLSKPVVTYCNSGMSSCTVAMAALHLGARHVAVFRGGFTEWTKKTA